MEEKEEKSRAAYICEREYERSLVKLDPINHRRYEGQGMILKLFTGGMRGIEAFYFFTGVPKQGDRGIGGETWGFLGIFGDFWG